MNNIYMDESGYTGFDLMNKEQPFQGASSLRIDNKTAKSLINHCFSMQHSLELKHKKLSKRKSHWKNLLEIQKIILQDHMGFTYICNKRYLLILFFLDICVEPFFYERKINFYEDGQNYSLASLLYYTAPHYWGADNFESLLFFFQRAMKTKLQVNIQVLIEKAKSLRNRELSEYLLPLISENISCIRELTSPNSNTDAAFVVILSLVSHIEKYIDSNYVVIHDKSKNLNSYNKLINNLINIDDNETFQSTEITRLTFPLKLSSVIQEDSKLSYGIQLADIVIGGIIENAMANYGLVKKNDYNQSVPSLYRDSNLIHLLPSIDFEKEKKFRCGTEAFKFIDFIADKMS